MREKERVLGAGTSLVLLPEVGVDQAQPPSKTPPPSGLARCPGALRVESARTSGPGSGPGDARRLRTRLNVLLPAQRTESTAGAASTAEPSPGGGGGDAAPRKGTLGA